ncbi:MAG: hypothetical protein WCJ42_01965 [Actinomycetes bacterium]
MSSQEQLAELITALLALRAKPASDEFDAAMERAGASGLVDPATSRELRWWHRASQDEFEQYVCEVLPAVLASIDDGDARANDAAARDRSAWNQAVEISVATGAAAPRPSRLAQSRSAADSGAGSAADSGAGAESGADSGSGSGADSGAGSGAGSEPESDPESDLNGASAAEAAVTYSRRPSGAPTRRRLVAGLTVLSEGQPSEGKHNAAAPMQWGNGC